MFVDNSKAKINPGNQILAIQGIQVKTYMHGKAFPAQVLSVSLQICTLINMQESFMDDYRERRRPS